ncbi:Hachiman antiphage defense system protein HamA [Microvirga arabica]|uniref:Hachiman antiphage defense system protein HamA n=1 Tax=Microvirga arabica TaxID=1128671 RepID=UPI00193932C7|nr:Hachiman antiphage defense system protein HamA [Microvirga arabica]MBM1170628.1 DUF1837 domain-containing protein [Microvirga arabica]
MVRFNDWCSTANTTIGAHSLCVLSADPARLKIAIDAIAVVVPGHYAAEEQIARVLTRLGKPASAEFIQGKLPATKSIRSGDLGEILATEYIASQGGYTVPVKRLRWKDHRNMAMRGDDVIGITKDQVTDRLRFLKAEAKSRAMLGGGVVAQARDGLDKDGGLPSAHALSFISSRLQELGEHALADAIIDAQLKIGIAVQDTRHLLFTFSGNAPDAYLTAALQTYTGPIAQWSVGLRVDGHTGFVGAIYDQVIFNAYNR